MNDKEAYREFLTAALIFKHWHKREDLECGWAVNELVKPKWTSRDYLILCALGVFDFERIGFWNHDDFIEVDFTSPEQLQKLIHEGIQNVKAQLKQRNLTIAGIITLSESLENKAKEGDHSAHALFFQCLDGYFRFHDSGSRLTGFFEFATEELLFENLVKHVKTWPEYSDGRLQFTIIGIPQKEDSDPDEVAII